MAYEVAPQVIFVIKVALALCAKMVIQALFVVRLETIFRFEDLWSMRGVSLDRGWLKLN